MHSIGEYLSVKVHSCVDGTIEREDIRILKQGIHVVVGTPGRVNYLMSRGLLKSDYLKLFILDEADELLSRRNKLQTQDIFKFLPVDIQICLFSATLPPDILGFAKQFMINPAKVQSE